MNKKNKTRNNKIPLSRANDKKKIVRKPIHKKKQTLINSEEKKTKLAKSTDKMTGKEYEKTLQELRRNQIQLEIQNKELRKIQLELQESKEKYLDLYDKAPVGYFTINDKGQVKETNQTAVNLLGVTRDMLLNQPILRYLGLEDQEIFNKHRKQVLSTGKTLTCELRMVKQDGTQFFAHIESSSAKDREGKSVCRTVVSDITEHKQTELALGDAHWRMESILEGAHIGTWEWNVQSGKVEVNERWAQSIGYNSVELKSISVKKWLTLTHPEDRKISIEILKQYFSGKLSYYDCEYRIKHKEGYWVWVRIRGSIITRTIDKKPLMMFGTYTDITTRKKAEEALRDAHWRLESIIVSARVGTWEWNVQTGKIVINERWVQIIGYSIEEFASFTVKKWEKLIHPNDLMQSNELIRRHFFGELPYYDFEFRMKHKNGNYVWIRNRGCLVTRTPDGKPYMMFGTITDITERKQAEEALKLRESHLTAIIENQPGLVWLKDKDGKFLVVNTAFALSRGKNDPEEIVGLTELDLCPKELAEKYKNEDEKVIKKKKPLRFEESVFEQDYIKWFETFRRPILDRNGKVIGTTGFKYFQGDKY